MAFCAVGEEGAVMSGGPDQACIAWISGPTPMIAITRFRL
jgi:hypothetical protein